MKYELVLAWIGHGKCCLPTFQLNPFWTQCAAVGRQGQWYFIGSAFDWVNKILLAGTFQIQLLSTVIGGLIFFWFCFHTSTTMRVLSLISAPKSSSIYEHICLAIQVQSPKVNLFIMGPCGTGRTETVVIFNQSEVAPLIYSHSKGPSVSLHIWKFPQRDVLYIDWMGFFFGRLCFKQSVFVVLHT